MMRRSALALATVVFLVGIVSAVIYGLSIQGKLDATNTPLIVTILGLVSASVPSLLALARVEDVKNDIKNVQEDIHNGVVKDKVKEALDEHEQEKENGNGR